MTVKDHWQSWSHLSCQHGGRARKIDNVSVLFNDELDTKFTELEKLPDGGFKLTLRRDDETGLDFFTEIILPKSDLDKLIEINNNFL